MSATIKEWRAAFLARSRRVAGGHRVWCGAYATRGTPIVFVRKERLTAARVAFVIAQGREPVGYAKAGCDRAGCVEPGHQTDRPMRAARREQDRAAAAPAVDEVAVELAVQGRLPQPRLSPEEKRAAVRLAPTTMPVITLARRIGACSRTVKKLRAEVATP
ncbi:hypothetical protein PV387_23125 [Streptomyces sp. ME02-6987-2C]|uniref:hypothetical protein n=1 Tax=unclassified Streptomyces TaxID=2593676 RepID=UPI0029A0E6C1|nr:MULTISPECIES: hypothetical protein [unclassified Streptomyces]MDX3345983.1 hypothetical protein [Streptomyces sp. ME02-6979A]MDX3368895.1 hypothetical protein [Streptomyces sp. ME02-6987-2C]MDX3407792.1 hypothetical protein [Streptomyces sp. ME02-6977A]MDX3421749.1 hypothetical protein [Streptomyces sp. ME02-6985-2c]